MTGKVWLVGAGPSDAGLFTLKGKKVLEQADVVIYDALVGQGVLSMIPAKTELIYVGKRASNHTMVQEEINQVLVCQAKLGKKVVRLKGGDPFLFGRGGEELELLVKEQIPYEVVPGVTSPLAVPAYNGIPVTHRDYCSSLHIITGHKKKDESYDINFEALVQTKGTLVFLMGVSALERICNGLIQAGMEQDMPAAIIQKGTTARQKRIVATVGTLYDETILQGIETPAIIIVGKVCQLADEFAWFEKLPLFGVKVLVTRPKQLISQMAEKLRREGAEVLELPAIEVVPITPNEQLKSALKVIETYQWLVFTSPSGVRIFFEQMKQFKMDIRQLGKIKIAVIGEGTKKELGKYGLFTDLMPKEYDGESLGLLLAEHCKKGDKILLPRAKKGNQALVDYMEKAGAVIDDIPTYDTVSQAYSWIEERKELEQGDIDYAVFTSASTVRAFEKAAKGIEFSSMKAICIGKKTKEAADQLGMITYVSKEAAMDSMVERLKEVVASEKGKDLA